MLCATGSGVKGLVWDLLCKLNLKDLSPGLVSKLLLPPTGTLESKDATSRNTEHQGLLSSTSTPAEEP